MKKIEEKANRVVELENLIAKSKGEDKIIQEASKEIEFILRSLSLKELCELDEIAWKKLSQKEN